MMLICCVGVQGSDLPALLLSSTDEVCQVLTAWTHLVVQGRVGQLRVEMIVVVGEEDYLAWSSPHSWSQLFQHPPDPGHMSHLPSQVSAPGETPVNVPAKHLTTTPLQRPRHPPHSSPRTAGHHTWDSPYVSEWHPLDQLHCLLHLLHWACFSPSLSPTEASQTKF